MNPPGSVEDLKKYILREIPKIRFMDFGLLYENDEGEYVVLNDVRMADIRLASPRLFTGLVYISTYCVPIALLRRTWGKFLSLPAKKPRKFEGGRSVALVATSGSQLSLFWHIEN